MADNTQLFIDEWNGKFIDVDGYPKSWPYQCKDLVQKYVTECLALPELPPGDAWAMFNAAPDSLYTKILNTPSNVPQKGDIMIWKRSWWAGLPFGHIDIFVAGDVNRFTSFAQNWPNKSACHIQPHNYNYVMGWLRRK